MNMDDVIRKSYTPAMAFFALQNDYAAMREQLEVYREALYTMAHVHPNRAEAIAHIWAEVEKHSSKRLSPAQREKAVRKVEYRLHHVDEGKEQVRGAHPFPWDTREPDTDKGLVLYDANGRDILLLVGYPNKAEHINEIMADRIAGLFSPEP